MAKATFNKPASGKAAAVIDVDENHDSQEASQALATIGGGAPVSGDLDRGDFIRPRLVVVQRTSELVGIHGLGAIVLNNDIKLSDGKTPLTAVVLEIRKSFIENLPFGGDERPRVLHTLEEVRKEGGTLTWVGDEKPTWLPQAEIAVAIQGDDDLVYEHEVEGKRFALAVMRLKGMAYNAAARQIFTTAKAVKGDLPSVQWNFSTKGEKTKNGTIYVPVFKTSGKVDAKVKAGLLAL